MQKRRWLQKVKGGIALVLCAVCLVGGPAPTVHAEKEQIKISDTEYAVTISGGRNMFMGNKIPIANKPGSKMFLVYTVKEVIENTVTQNGVLGTDAPKEPYPYAEKGGMYVRSQSVLFEEGCTYAIRFEQTESGFTYKCAKMKGEETSYIDFGQIAGDVGKNYPHFGIWLGNVTGKQITKVRLSTVHCYDENGNDLGVDFNHNGGSATAQMDSKLLDVHLTIGHRYDFDLVGLYNVAISNKYPTDSKNVYMEYEVGKVSVDRTNQAGLIVSSDPTINYPHTQIGLLQVGIHESEKGQNPMLQEGAKYFICFSKKEDTFAGIVQRTIKGKTETFSFPRMAGEYSTASNYFSVWLGEGGAASAVNAEIRNFKCYDENGINLGAQVNKPVVITHTGEVEDYSKTEATYYCEENQTLIVLEDKQKAIKQTGYVKENCTYKIYNDVELQLSFKDGKEVYEYTYLIITDENGNRYRRLRDTKVRFVTGEQIIEEEVKAENGYRVLEPEAPKKKGNTFLGWYLGNGKPFDFESIVSETITLYAKWKDGDGNEYLAVEQPEVSKDYSMSIAIAVASVTIVGCAAICIVIVKRRKHYEK